MSRPIELLIPASSLEVLKTAVIFGADAVYIGGEAFGLRAKAKNFSMEEMKEGIEFAHAHDVKVYVTANILAHNDDLEGVREYFEELREIKPDALIIADPGVFEIAKEVCPEIERHISTQANNTNYATYNFWYRQGASRVVSARELSLKEIKEIRERIPEDLEIETFVHGAMCISYSGRCLLSNYFTGRDANQGACTHPCRWKYAVVEEKRPGEYLPVYENERGTYIFNSKDLCMIEHIPELIDAGIDSFNNGRLLDLELSALEQKQQVDIIASPRLLASHMQPASIKQGSEIPYQVSSGDSGATSVEFKEAVLGMEVTPVVLPGGRVRLKLHISENMPGQVLQQADGETLAIDKQEIETQVEVKSGETLALGGIFSQKNKTGSDRVPGLGNIPWLGQLFRHDGKDNERRELVVFITPRLVGIR